MSNSDFNQIILMGYTGKAPRVLSGKSEKTACSVPLATTQRWMHEGKEHTLTHWHSLIFSGKLGDVALAHITQGQRLFIEGELRYQKVEDPETKKVHYNPRVKVNHVRFLSSEKAKADSNLAEDRLKACYQVLEGDVA